MVYQAKFEESLKQLDLKGIILIQGLLSQRAIELMLTEEDKKPLPTILLPEKKLIDVV